MQDAKALTQTNLTLRNLLEVVAEHQLNIDSLLKRYGGSQTEQGLGRPISRERFITLVEEIIAEVPIPGLGLLCGKRWQTLETGAFGYALTSSENLRKSLSRHRKYQDITQPIVRLTDIISPSVAAVVAEPAEMSAAAYRFFTEEWIAAWTQVGLRFGATTHWLSEVQLSYKKPDYSGLYNEIFGCPIRFDAPDDRIVFSPRYLDMPYAIGNEAVASFCEHQLELMQEQSVSGAELEQQVRQILINSDSRFPQKEQVAELLGISPRKLHRKLKEQDTSYQTILNEVRMLLAEDYLANTDLPIGRIAELLGYNEIPNFHRAFVKWVGKTPATYREAKKP